MASPSKSLDRASCAAGHPASHLPRSCRSLQGVTPSSSGLLVRRSGFDLAPLGAGPCRLPAASFRCSIDHHRSPRGLSTLPRRQTSLPARSHGALQERAPLPRLLPRSLPTLRRISSGCVHSPSPAHAGFRHDLASVASFRLRRFDDLDGFLRTPPFPSLLGKHPWAFVLQGSSRTTVGLAVPDAACPSWRFSPRPRSRRELSPRRCAAPPGLSMVRPSPPASSFPSSGARDPHGLSCGTSVALHPTGKPLR